MFYTVSVDINVVLINITDWEKKYGGQGKDSINDIINKYWYRKNVKKRRLYSY